MVGEEAQVGPELHEGVDLGVHAGEDGRAGELLRDPRAFGEGRMHMQGGPNHARAACDGS